jgi:hypothetical protein
MGFRKRWVEFTKLGGLCTPGTVVKRTPGLRSAALEIGGGTGDQRVILGHGLLLFFSAGASGFLTFTQ